MVDIATLGLEVRSESLLRAAANVDKFAGTTQRLEQRLQGFSTGTTKMESALSRVEDRLQYAGRALNGFNNVLQMLGVSLAIKEVAGLADTWSDLNSRVRIAAGGIEQGTEVMDRLSEMARRTYSSLEDTTETYIRNATAMRELGYNTDQTLDYVESINNALVVSGAKGDRAASVMEALSKAMALGKLSGQNLETVLASGGRVAEALANSMGVTANQLRKLGADGKITGTEIYGITKELQKLRDEADSMPATVGDAFVIMRNSVLRYVGVLDQSNKLSENFAENIINLADHIEVVGGAMLVVGGISGARFLGPMIASIGKATIANTALTASMLKGNAVMLDGRTAALQKANYIRQAALADQQAARAALDVANAERIRAIASLEAARAGKLVGVTQAQAAAQVTAANRAVSASQVAYKTTTDAVTRSTILQNSAMKNATASARVMGVAMAAANKAMSFVGGPVGAAMLALGSALYFVSSKAQEAQERSDRYAEAIRNAGADTEKAKDLIKNAGKELFNVDGIKSQIEAIEKGKQATRELADIYNEIGANIAVFSDKTSGGIGGGPFEEHPYQGLINELQELKKSAEDTSIPIEVLREKASKLGVDNPNMNGLNALLLKIVELANQARTASGAIDTLNEKKRSFDDNSDLMLGPSLAEYNRGKPIKDYLDQRRELLSLSKEERDIREQTEREKQNASSKGVELSDSLARELAVESLKVKSSDNAAKSMGKQASAYQDVIQQAEDRIEQIKLEAQTAGLSGIAADTLMMKLELEQKAREKTGMVTDKQRQKIDQIVASYQSAAEAAAKAALQADVYTERMRMGMSSIEGAVYDRMTQYGLMYGSDPQIEAAIRYNEQLKVGQGLMSGFLSTVSSSALNSRNALESLGDGLKNVGNQLISMAEQQLVAQAFGPLLGGGGSSGGLFGSLFGGLFGGGGSSFVYGQPQGFRSNDLANALVGGGVGLYAQGAAFGQNAQMFANGGAFTNSIYSSPTAFRFADGGGFSNGIMGEAGPEAVMPLKRDARGALGVAVNGWGSGKSNGGSTAVTVDVAVTMEDNGKFRAYVKNVSQETTNEGLKEYDRQLPDTIGQKIGMAQQKNRMGF